MVGEQAFQITQARRVGHDNSKVQAQAWCMELAELSQRAAGGLRVRRVYGGIIGANYVPVRWSRVMNEQREKVSSSSHEAMTSPLKLEARIRIVLLG